jgi:hypothetical protein
MHSENNAFEKKVVMVGASYYIPKVSEQHSKLSGGMKGCISVKVLWCMAIFPHWAFSHQRKP